MTGSISLPIAELVESHSFRDARGEFRKLFSVSDSQNGYINNRVEQVNLSTSHKSGTLRGMHYQEYPFSEQKIVSCIRGSIFDVVVDLRRESPSFLQWKAFELNSAYPYCLVIPEGYAHGFQTLEDDTSLIYVHSEVYSNSSERGIHYLDPTLKIEWPLYVTSISDRDKNLPNINEGFRGIENEV